MLTLTKLGVWKWVRSLFHRNTSAPSLIWLSHINLVHRAGFEPALETRPSGHSFYQDGQALIPLYLRRIKSWRQPTQKVCLMCRPLYPLIFVCTYRFTGGGQTTDKFQSPKIGGGGEIRTLFILPYEDNVLPIILPHHIKTHFALPNYATLTQDWNRTSI